MSAYDNDVTKEFNRLVAADAYLAGKDLTQWLGRAEDEKIQQYHAMAEENVKALYKMQEQAALHRGQAAQSAQQAAEASGQEQEGVQAFEMAVASKVGELVQARSALPVVSSFRRYAPIIAVTGLGVLALALVIRKRKRRA